MIDGLCRQVNIPSRLSSAATYGNRIGARQHCNKKGNAALGGLFVIISSVVSSPRSFFEDQTW
jgi:hypothetical protein